MARVYMSYMKKGIVFILNYPNSTFIAFNNTLRFKLVLGSLENLKLEVILLCHHISFVLQFLLHTENLPYANTTMIADT